VGGLSETKYKLTNLKFPMRVREKVHMSAKVTECARAARPPTHALPLGRPSNSLGPVWANMYSDPFSATTLVGIGLESPVRVK